MDTNRNLINGRSDGLTGRRARAANRFAAVSRMARRAPQGFNRSAIRRNKPRVTLAGGLGGSWGAPDVDDASRGQWDEYARSPLKNATFVGPGSGRGRIGPSPSLLGLKLGRHFRLPMTGRQCEDHSE